jgi:hypothetical protein
VAGVKFVTSMIIFVDSVGWLMGRTKTFGGF